METTEIIQYTKTIKPIITITVKNMSNKLLRDVELLDYDNKNSGIINYISLNPVVSYNEILRQMTSLRDSYINIDRLLIQAHDNSGLELEQSKKSILVCSKSISGSYDCKRINVKINNYQHRRNMANLEVSFKLYYNTNILLSELLPLQNVTITIYSDTPTISKVSGHFESSIGLILKNTSNERIDSVSVLNNEDTRIEKSTLLEGIDYLGIVQDLKNKKHKFSKIYVETDCKPFILCHQEESHLNILLNGQNPIKIKLSEQTTIAQYVIDEDTNMILEFIEPNTEIKFLFIY